LVGQKIPEIAEDGMGQLFHSRATHRCRAFIALGPAAISLLQGRRGMTDEEWVDLHSSEEQTYLTWPQHADDRRTAFAAIAWS